MFFGNAVRTTNDESVCHIHKKTVLDHSGQLIQLVVELWDIFYS
jgi:hypothetical protein